MSSENHQHRAILEKIAHRVMLERGLLPDFSPAVQAELGRLVTAAPVHGKTPLRDLRSLLWCSIDDDDSLDLDQLTVGESLPGGLVKFLVAIADVDALIGPGSAIDEHARHNTTSVYTAAEIFPMLPEKCSTGLTSLNPDSDRLSLVVEMVVDPSGALQSSQVYRAAVHNQAKLAYNGLAAWLEGQAGMPLALARVPGLAENLRLQDRAAQSLKEFRHQHGALSLETIETRPVFDGDQVRELQVEHKNRARELVENLMIAANGVTARFLSEKNFPSIRRVVRTPKRWDRILEIAARHGERLPQEPDSRPLEDFLNRQKAADPLRFPDLSLSIVKLLGAGEYTAELPGQTPPGHFGLAVKDYAHSTAPNRRYTDLITQRLLKAALAGAPSPYPMAELEALALHCTQNEDVANKVERQVNKSAAALLLENRLGESFAAIVTGASPKGTWVRLLNPPVEGRLVQGEAGLDVGDRVEVQLVFVDVDRGYIDFKKGAGSSHHA
jgi:VacB/RNase II family 3'-5' exoribonuclease